jgi:hypothetical protein
MSKQVDDPLTRAMAALQFLQPLKTDPVSLAF